MAAANWSDAEVLRLIEVLHLNRAVGSTLNRTVVKISINLAFFHELRRLNEDSLLSVDCIHLLRKLLGTTSVSKCNKSDGVVRDAITDQSTQHARKFVSRAVDTRAHAHRYYRILPTCGRALNRSMNIVVQCKQGQNRSTERFQQAIQNRSMQV